MQENKKIMKNSKLDDLGSLKNLVSLNESLMEAIKAAIKAKNNDIAFKMMENVGERPELWNEYLTVALLNQNFGFVKGLIEKFGIDIRQLTGLNAGVINNEMASTVEGYNPRKTDNKDIYATVESPLVIQAAVGGDIDTLEYLVGRGASLTDTGHFALSRKNKNSVSSNILAAAAYFGRTDLVHFILDKYKSVVIDSKCTEKKSKVKQFTLQKDFTDLTPVLLTVASEFPSEEDSIEILKLLFKYGADFSLIDYNRNSIIHLAAKYNKLKIVKFIIEDLKLEEILGGLNKEGQTPVAIAEANPQIVDYLWFHTKLSPSYNIEEDLNELVESQSKRQKGRKGKKKDKVGVSGVGGSEWQEVLKVKKEEEIVKENPKVIVKEVTIVKDESNVTNYSKKLNSSIDIAQPSNEKKNYKVDRQYKDYYNYNNKDYYKTNTSYNTKSYNDKNYDRYYYTEGTGDSRRNYKEKERKYFPQVNEIKADNLVADNNKLFNTNNGQEDVILCENDTNSKVNQKNNNENINTDISNSQTAEKLTKYASPLIGLGSKQVKKTKKDNNESKENVSYDSLDQNEKKHVLENPSENLDRNEKVNPEIVEQNVNPITNNITEPLIEKTQLSEESENEEEDFLQEEEKRTDEHKDYQLTVSNPDDKLVACDNNSIKDSQNESLQAQENIQQPVQSSEYFLELTSKYLLLEKKYENERKDKQEIEKYISQKNVIKPALRKSHVVTNSDDNIQDLLSIANEELERKSKIISDLQAKIEYLEGKNLDRLDEGELNQLSSFHGARLSSIVAIINNLSNKNK